MLSNISYPIVGAVDVAMMGHLGDPSFVGGVGLGMLSFNLLYFSFGFLRMSTTGFTAHARGEGNRDKTTSLLVRGLMLAGLSGTVLLLIHPMLLWLASLTFDASPTVERHMSHYISVRIWAIPAALANLTVVGWLYGMQLMRMGMVQLFVVNFINVGLNALFVVGLNMNVTGVALASVIAQWTGLAVMLWVIFRYRRRLQLTGIELSRTYLLIKPR